MNAKQLPHRRETVPPSDAGRDSKSPPRSLSSAPYEYRLQLSLYERMGVLLGLRTALHSELDLVERLEAGLPARTAQTLCRRAGLTEAEANQLIAPRRTLSRRKERGQPLSRDEADRVVRVARLFAHAQQVFSSNPIYAGEWLRAPKFALGGRAPMRALMTESGARAVEEILIRIDHGMFG